MIPITSLALATDQTIKAIKDAQTFGWHSTQLAIPEQFCGDFSKILSQTPTLSFVKLRGGVFEISWTGDPEAALQDHIVEVQPAPAWPGNFFFPDFDPNDMGNMDFDPQTFWDAFGDTF